MREVHKEIAERLGLDGSRLEIHSDALIYRLRNNTLLGMRESLVKEDYILVRMDLQTKASELGEYMRCRTFLEGIVEFLELDKATTAE